MKVKVAEQLVENCRGCPWAEGMSKHPYYWYCSHPWKEGENRISDFTPATIFPDCPLPDEEDE